MKLQFRPENKCDSIHHEDAIAGHIYRASHNHENTPCKYLCVSLYGSNKYFMGLAENGNLYLGSDLCGPLVDCGPGVLEITIP